MAPREANVRGRLAGGGSAYARMGSVTRSRPGSQWRAHRSNAIQAQVGHASLATTDRYLRRIAPADLLVALKLPAWTPPA